VARAARKQGIVDFTLDVGADGRVTGCTINRSSGSAHLDSATCGLMRSRARFTPAHDARGVPVPDKVSGKIMWRL
jgi:protein TonB